MSIYDEIKQHYGNPDREIFQVNSKDVEYLVWKDDSLFTSII